MKLKYYVRGVGVGILFATIILAISFHIRINNQNTLTDEQIIQEVKKRGLTETIVKESGHNIYDMNHLSTEETESDDIDADRVDDNDVVDDNQSDENDESDDQQDEESDDDSSDDENE